MNNTACDHRAESPQSVSCAVITVSDTRTLATDSGGDCLAKKLSEAGHSVVVRELIPDEPETMRILVRHLAARDDVDAIFMTGGTGISARDQTYETISGLLDKPLPGYGELFRHVSFADIGAAAMLSRAVGGVMGQTLLLTMPGSPAAVRLALERLILPEIGHLVREATR